MPITAITPYLAQIDVIEDALQRCAEGRVANLVDYPEAAGAVLMASTIERLGKAAMVVTTRQERAESLASALAEYLPTGRQVHVWNSPDALPYEQLPVDLEAGVQRVHALNQLLATVADTGTVWVVSIHGLMQLLVPPEALQERTRTLRVGRRADVEALHRWAVENGYVTSPVVQDPGTIARRGGIVDLFPPGVDHPIRLDFFGDEVESIRTFDPHNQRSIERLNQISLLPSSELPLWRFPDVAEAIARLDRSTLRSEVATEWEHRLELMRNGAIADSVDLFAGYLVPEKSHLLDYLPTGAMVLIDQPDAVERVAKQIESQARDLNRTFRETGELPKGLLTPFVPAARVLERVRTLARLRFGASEADEAEALSVQAVGDAPMFAGNVGLMIDTLRSQLAEGWAIAIATDQVDRVTDVLEEREVYPRRVKSGTVATLAAGEVEVQSSDLMAGWSWSAGKVAVWTDFEIFGFRKQPRRSSGRSVGDRRSFAQSLVPGEVVVHIDHGIARFVGLVRMEVQEIEREYLLLEFDKGDKLYVPVDQSDRVSRYSGGGLNPALNRLGSGEWTQTKRKVRRAVREMAFELIQLYAYREAGTGFQFPPASRWDVELAESFPYTETVDQAKAIDAVIADMESPRPMDRLVCGDVGFGKTEVAIRAAFKAANAGKQVAVLVPTTVLALQHFNNFQQRLGAFPVRVEMMSRLRTKREQDEVMDGLRKGSVDIVIGTHRIVQKDMEFKDLGLVIVDEEQRFGVRHKEFLKQLRTEVDVLTMSATPIPRTLHLSLSGIRDISMIETAPRARLPIRTFVTGFTDQLIREVILRELDRGGQVFVVHNRVHDIDRLAGRLREAVPEASFGIGHGQMDEQVLEQVMLGFMRHEFDVLLATTIIESGVDIPNVNTIIIDNADTLGLTQLYQLRGRVGRSNHRAYAYLLHQPNKSLSAEALERLETIQEATELGAGLRVAMRDLEIRGAGNMLGAEQSGHIATVGYELYVRLLGLAIDEVRSGKPAVERGPVTLDLPLTALLPEDYVADTELRLNLYRQIAAVESDSEADDLADELRDRFGDFPEEVDHLFALIRLRIRSQKMGIDSLVERDREIVIRPVETGAMDKRRLTNRLGGAIRFTQNSVRLRLLELSLPWEEALDLVLSEVERVTQAAEPAFA